MSFVFPPVQVTPSYLRVGRLVLCLTCGRYRGRKGTGLRDGLASTVGACYTCRTYR